MTQFHGNRSGEHVHGDGSVPSGVPLIDTVTPGDTSITFTYTGPATHYRLTPLDTGVPGAALSIPPSPVTVSGLDSNREYRVEIGPNATTWTDSIEAGTNNPGTGGGEFDPTPPPSPAVLSSPTTSGVTFNGATVGATTDVESGTLFVAVTTSATPPSSDAIKAGTGFPASASQAISSAGAKTFALSGLLASTTYYHHHVQASAGGDSNILSSASFTTSAAPPPPPPPAQTITLQLLDAAVGGSPLAGLSPIRWATYDGAAQLSETWGVAPTDSGLTESADGAAQLVLELPNTTRTSGQGIYLQLEAGSGAGVRTFGAVVLVD